MLDSLAELASRIRAGEDVEREYMPPALDLPVLSCTQPPVVTDYPSTVPNLQFNSQPSQHQSNETGQNEQEGRRLVRALYSLDAKVEEERTFKEGDCIEVIREDPSGWWEGRLDGKTGRFPCNYTEACFTVCSTSHPQILSARVKAGKSAETNCLFFKRSVFTSFHQENGYVISSSHPLNIPLPCTVSGTNTCTNQWEIHPTNKYFGPVPR